MLKCVPCSNFNLHSPSNAFWLERFPAGLRVVATATDVYVNMQGSTYAKRMRLDLWEYAVIGRQSKYSKASACRTEHVGSL